MDVNCIRYILFVQYPFLIKLQRKFIWIFSLFSCSLIRHLLLFLNFMNFTLANFRKKYPTHIHSMWACVCFVYSRWFRYAKPTQLPCRLLTCKFAKFCFSASNHKFIGGQIGWISQRFGPAFLESNPNIYKILFFLDSSFRSNMFKYHS